MSLGNYHPILSWFTRPPQYYATSVNEHPGRSAKYSYFFSRHWRC